MDLPVGKLVAALLTATIAASLTAVPAVAQISYGPCPETNNFSCGTLKVPLDPSGQTPGTVTLAIRRHRAPVGDARVAVIALAGGPGQAANSFASDFAQELGPIISTRDLVVFDQRGTGNSHPLSCHAFEESASSESAGQQVAKCAQQIGPARAFYTTADSVADIEAIRVAGGYEKLVLYGTSYGTKVAEQYAQDYPGDVEALILDSVVPPNGPEQLMRSTFAAIPRVLSQLCAYEACKQITHHPVADLTRLVQRMRRGPLRGRVIDGEGVAHTLSISSDELLEILIAGDLDPILRAEFPAAVHSALSGDVAPLARLDARAQSGEGSDEIDVPLYYATTCEEQIFPWNRTASPATRLKEAKTQIDKLPATTFAPFTAANAFDVSDIPQCAFWPFTSAGPELDEHPLPHVPTLIFSGADDLRTPTANAREVAKEIPDSHLLVVPNVGHSVLGSDLTDCSSDALQAFFKNKPIEPCGKTPLPAILRPTPLAPRKLERVPPAKGYRGRVGRTLQAVVLTLRDLSRQLALDASEDPYSEGLTLRIGGLRKGWMSDGPQGLTFHHYSYIPGVSISGIIATGKATLMIRGTAASRGTLRLSPRQDLSGVLEGTPVHLKRVNLDAVQAQTAALRQTAQLSGTPGD